jgi:hypothetical protein
MLAIEHVLVCNLPALYERPCVPWTLPGWRLLPRFASL